MVRFLIAEGCNERTRRKDKWYEDQSREELVPFDERINSLKVITVFFEKDGFVYAVPWMTPTVNMNTFCNDLFPERIWGKFEKNPSDYNLTPDFFYWLINVFTRGNKRVSFSPEVIIRAWTGFLGTTQDSSHRLSGEGEKISAILSSLAFIFMNDPFKAVNMVIQYENERIPVALGSLGNLGISENEYEGQYSIRYGGNQRKVLLTYLMYTKILPALFNAYGEARRLGQWNETVKEEFTTFIGDTIVSRVKKALP